MLKSIAVGAFVSLSLLASTNASAIEITIDPGNVGDTYTERSFGFSELDGALFNGSSYVLDFVFADMKHLEINKTSGFQAAIVLRHNQGQRGPIQSPGPSGFLSDEFGANIQGPSQTGRTTNSDWYRYSLAFFFIPFDEFIFHDVHFTITLAPFELDEEFVSIESASLILQSFGDDGFLEVGEWTSDPTDIPEPATLGLFAIGLAGLGVMTRRRRRSDPAS